MSLQIIKRNWSEQRWSHFLHIVNWKSYLWRKGKSYRKQAIGESMYILLMKWTMYIRQLRDLHWKRTLLTSVHYEAYPTNLKYLSIRIMYTR